MFDRIAIFACAAAAATTAQPVAAAEETLSFRLVTRIISVASHTDGNVEGLKLTAGQSVGVAVFDDGRLAAKEYVYLSYSGENAPAMQPGYSSYVFQNGDSLQVSFEYGPKGAFNYPQGGGSIGFAASNPMTRSARRAKPRHSTVVPGGGSFRRSR